ncbi:MAG TPA: AarF/UbiB family protein, partial [Pirellulaceae bacterium]
MPSIAELISALPETVEGPESHDQGPWPALMEAWSLRPVPAGRFRRLSMLGTLQAKIGAAYLFHWLRGWFKDADENKRLLAETHWRTALRVLDSMSYLRGATMKVGQTLASFPDIVPREFVETLERLHFEAPPMHWSLLRELVHNELGDDPEHLFASFEQRALAAASLGQVHRARLQTGEEVAIKIQYPGIARTIREDIRNLLTFMLPARLSRD